MVTMPFTRIYPIGPVCATYTHNTFSFYFASFSLVFVVLLEWWRWICAPIHNTHQVSYTRISKKTRKKNQDENLIENKIEWQRSSAIKVYGYQPMNHLLSLSLINKKLLIGRNKRLCPYYPLLLQFSSLLLSFLLSSSHYNFLFQFICSIAFEFLTKILGRSHKYGVNVFEIWSIDI